MRKKLFLSRDDKKIGGVCGGLAEYFEVDATVIRILWVIAFFIYGLGLLPYIICWLIIPREKYIGQ